MAKTLSFGSWQLRVEVELDDLKGRFKELDKFGRSEEYQELSTEQQGLLNKQYKCMEEYISILEQRIALEA